MLALKRNQNSLYEDVQEYFSDEEFQKEIRERGNYKKNPGKSTWSDRDKGVLSDRGYKVVKPEKELERTVQYSNGEENAEERRKYKNREPLFHQSLKGDIEQVSRAVRGHWSIESMHWYLDVTFREDANTTLDKMAAQNLNIIRKWS